MKLIDMTALELAAAIKGKQVTVKQAVEAVWEQIEQKEALYHCYITANRERAMQQAAKIQQKIDHGEFTGSLAGVPVAIKDNLCMEGMPTTCGSRMLENFVPVYTAEAVKKLEQAGMVIVGKTNMDEFAMGSTTETSAFGITRNPWNTNHVPGGSSGGSAAAVAAGECFLALGTDTGGSIRQPAAHCGVVGLKPTYGTVSRYGLIAYASSMDQIGPIAKNVADCTALLEVITSYDQKDATSIERSDTNFSEALAHDVKGMKIGIPRNYLNEGIHPEVKEAVGRAADRLEQKGALLKEFDLGLSEYAIPAYYTIAAAEASSNLERFDGIKYGYGTKEYRNLSEFYEKTRSEGFGREAKRRILLGSFVLSAGYYDAYYLRAQKVRRLIKEAFDSAFSDYDIILAPVAPTTAPKIGGSLTRPIQMCLSDIYTISANLAGIPAISVPCGSDSAGLPIGIQLMADCFEEKKLIRAAYALESKGHGY